MNYSIEPFGGSLAFFEVLAGAELVVSIEEQCDAANGRPRLAVWLRGGAQGSSTMDGFDHILNWKLQLGSGGHRCGRFRVPTGPSRRRHAGLLLAPDLHARDVAE